jgi:hypothetical protein
VILIIQLQSIQKPPYHPLFRNKVKKSTKHKLNQGNRSINKRIGVVHIQLKDALNSNYHLATMQSLWGCAYEMRSLGDVNYKITRNGYKIIFPNFKNRSVILRT